jgi:hypothetical protein
MKTLLSIALLAATAAAFADTGPSTRREAETAWSQAGLQRVDMRGMDVAYVRPGANLAQYRSVLLRPVGVSFQRNWQRSIAESSGSRIPERDLRHVVDDVSNAVRVQVQREFERGGYSIASAPGPGVLEIDLRITELFLNAPDLPTAAQTRSYTKSFGEMNLVADLRDSQSGEVVMSVLDRNLGRSFDELRRTTRVENAYEVGLAAQGWAGMVRRQLELARASAQESNGRP